MDVVKEQTTYIVSAHFTDQDGAATTPSSGTYRIDDITGGVITEVTGDTSFTPSDTSHDIEITPDKNTLVNPENQIEYRLMTVRFTYGSARQGAAEYRWCVENMRGI